MEGQPTDQGEPLGIVILVRDWPDEYESGDGNENLTRPAGRRRVKDLASRVVVG